MFFWSFYWLWKTIRPIKYKKILNTTKITLKTKLTWTSTRFAFSSYWLVCERKNLCGLKTLREKCPYSELFWSAFSRIQSECGKMRTTITPNMDTFYAVKKSWDKSLGPTIDLINKNKNYRYILWLEMRLWNTEYFFWWIFISIF